MTMPTFIHFSGRLHVFLGKVELEELSQAVQTLIDKNNANVLHNER